MSFQADPTTLDFEIQLRDYLMAFIEDRECPGGCTIDFSVASGYGDVAKGGGSLVYSNGGVLYSTTIIYFYF